MSDRLRTPNVAAAAVFLGGLAVVARPEHVLSIVQVVLVTIAAAAGLYALAVHVPPTGWMSPFKWMSPFLPDTRAGRRTDDLRPLRSLMSGRRQPVEGAPPLPPGVIRVLQPLIRGALQSDPTRTDLPRDAEYQVSELTWAVLKAEPLKRPPWYRSRWPNRREVAEVVHHVLGDVERLTHGSPAPHPDSRHPKGIA